MGPNNPVERTRINPRALQRYARRHQHSVAERSNIVPMRVTTGKVIEGKVVVEGLPLEEGAVVTVLARESDETFLGTSMPCGPRPLRVGEVRFIR
jgi:hypothetical protein